MTFSIIFVIQLYPTEITIQSGTGNTAYDTELSAQIPELEVGKIDSYFLYKIPWNKLPQVFHKTRIYSDNQYLEARDITPEQDVSATYISNYDQYNASAQQGSWQEFIIDNDTYNKIINDDRYRLYNNMSIRKAGAYIWTTQGMRTWNPMVMFVQKTGQDYTDIIDYNSSLQSSISFSNFLLGLETIPATTIVHQIHTSGSTWEDNVELEIPELTPDLFSNGPFVFTSGEWTITLVINNYLIQTFRDINLNNSITQYTNAMPMIRIVEDDVIHYRALRGGCIRYPNFLPYDTVATKIKATINISNGAVTEGGSLHNGYVSGFYFKFERSVLNSIPNDKLIFNGNCAILKKWGTQLYVYRVFTPEEILKHLRMYPRIMTNSNYWTSYNFTNYYGIPYIESNNEFKNDLNFSTFEEIGDKLREWQYETFQQNSYRISKDFPERDLTLKNIGIQNFIDKFIDGRAGAVNSFESSRMEN